MKRLVLVGVAAVLGAVLVIGAGVTMRQEPAARPSVTASPAAPASCDPVLEQPVEGHDHIDSGPIRYAAAPPATGDHRGWWAEYSRNFYDVRDRPEVEELVHNLEHGYNILWYDTTVAEAAGQLDDVRRIAESYDGGRNEPTTALIAAPWTATDGAAFPEGRHYALTHWYADPDDRTRSRTDERGYTRYCTTISDDIVQEWMSTYPLRDAPEGMPGNM